MIVSFTVRIKAFQKLKEISPGKCDWLRLFHPIQQRFVRSLHPLLFFLSLSLSSLPLSPSLPSSFSVTCNSREDRNGVDLPQSRAKKGTNRKGTKRKRDRIVDRERRMKGERGVRRRNGIHFEIASHPVRSPFSTVCLLYPDTLPRPFPSSFPQEKPLPLLDSHRPSRSLSLWLAPFRETACSPRILISSKVLFPLNRAATRNNALYVRVSRLSLPLSLDFSSHALVIVLFFVSC